MDRTYPTPVQNEIEFLLSLLHISSPGQPVSKQSEAIERMLGRQRPLAAN